MLNTHSLQISPEILRLIARIDEFKGAWRALGTLAPDRLSALRRIATIESIGSSTRIEGSKLSDRDVERLLSNLSIQSFDSRDEQEVAGYAELMDLVFSAWQDIPFNENHIKQLHQVLLKHSNKDSRHRGAYKTSSNSVAAFDLSGVQIGIVFKTPGGLGESLNTSEWRKYSVVVSIYNCGPISRVQGSQPTNPPRSCRRKK